MRNGGTGTKEVERSPLQGGGNPDIISRDPLRASCSEPPVLLEEHGGRLPWCPPQEPTRGWCFIPHFTNEHSRLREPPTLQPVGLDPLEVSLGSVFTPGASETHSIFGGKAGQRATPPLQAQEMGGQGTQPTPQNTVLDPGGKGFLRTS